MKIPTHKRTIIDYIEGCINDYENGETDKNELINQILKLIIKIIENKEEQEK